MFSKKLKSIPRSFFVPIFIFCMNSVAMAQTGGEIFEQSACGILGDVLAADFGAMITVIAGSLAILASVTGSFRGAWALLFVSVGSFIFPDTVKLLFPLDC
jgi:hypothetical protein